MIHKSINILSYPLKALASKIFEMIVNFRNDQFDKNKIKTYRTVKPLISIGNISMGGTGKTPLTLFLCKLIIELGYNPSVIGLGYKRKSKGPLSIQKDNKINTSWDEIGDEMYLIHQKLNIPVYVHEKKYQAALVADKDNSDILILDDGYQHRYLERDLNILILDEKSFNEPFVVPKGYLRESFTAMKRADLIFLPNTIQDISALTQLDQDKLIRFKFVNSKPYLLSNKEITLSKDIGLGLLAFCGIANPQRFFHSVSTIGYNISKTLEFPDHYDYSRKNIMIIIAKALESNVKTLITTEKDATKLFKFADILEEHNLDCFVLPVDIEITSRYEILLQKVNSLLK